MRRFAHVFPPYRALRNFVARITSTRQENAIRRMQAGDDALSLLVGGLAAYLNDSHGPPKTDSALLDLLIEKRICILAVLHAVQDSDARKYLISGLIELLSSRTTAIVLRSGRFETYRPPIPPIDDAS